MSIIKTINYFGKILVVNLERDINKLQKFLTNFSKSLLKDQLCVFKGVDGKKLDIRIIEDDILTKKGRLSVLKQKQEIFGISLTYGSLGCALSHYLVLQECSKQTKPYLIFEDDARIIDNFDTELALLIDHITHIRLQYDILYLGLHNIPALNKTNRYNELLYIPNGLTCGLWAMIISPVGAKKILDMAFPLSVQIDSQISNIKHKLKMYATHKELAEHCWEFGSSTQNQKSCETLVGDLYSG